jgi:hypothetical protein
MQPANLACCAQAQSSFRLKSFVRRARAGQGAGAVHRLAAVVDAELGVQVARVGADGVAGRSVEDLPWVEGWLGDNNVTGSGHRA